MDFWERLENEVNKRSNRKEIAFFAAIAVNSFSTWKKRKTFPAVDVAVRISQALGVTAEYLVTGSDSTDPWIREHRAFIEDCKALTQEQFLAVETTAKTLAQTNRTKETHT